MATLPAVLRPRFCVRNNRRITFNIVKIRKSICVPGSMVDESLSYYRSPSFNRRDCTVYRGLVPTLPLTSGHHIGCRTFVAQYAVFDTWCWEEQCYTLFARLRIVMAKRDHVALVRERQINDYKARNPAFRADLQRAEFRHCDLRKQDLRHANTIVRESGAPCEHY
jgi:hypothetical protein